MPAARTHMRSRACRLPSNPQHTAHQHPDEAQIHYPFHPQCGQQVHVLGAVRARSCPHYTIVQPDGTRSLLPAWMCEPAAAQLTIVPSPVFPRETLKALRLLLNSAITSSSRYRLGEDSDATFTSAARTSPDVVGEPVVTDDRVSASRPCGKTDHADVLSNDREGVQQ